MNAYPLRNSKACVIVLSACFVKLQFKLNLPVSHVTLSSTWRNTNVCNHSLLTAEQVISM